jgi:hypothetical protein
VISVFLIREILCVSVHSDTVLVISVVLMRRILCCTLGHRSRDVGSLKRGIILCCKLGHCSRDICNPYTRNSSTLL